jgi:putative heme-binding domain-containing protein
MMMMIRLARAALLFAGLSAAAPVDVRAQATADVEPGKKLFQGMCARCHGIDGTGDEGPNLNRPTLSRAGDDDSLRAVIRDGIPDRGMPRVRRLTDNELNQLVVYVRSLGRTTSVATSGNAGRGRELYGRLGCASCHIIGGTGGSFGPDLSAIGAGRGAAYLRQSFLGPAEALPRGASPVPGRGFTEYLPVRIVTKDGTEIRGVRINEDPFTMQVKDLGNMFHSVRKSDVKAIEKDFGKSAMPSFRGRLSDAESDDLVAYLSSLRSGM